MAKPTESISLMEPMLPSPVPRVLEDLSVSLIEKSAGMAAQLNPLIQARVGELVRSMNCYYSNLIEGHNTSPRDIERALKDDFSNTPDKRDLQLEAKAHIEVQSLLDTDDFHTNIFSGEIIKWIHQQFYNRLPDSLCWAKNPDTEDKIRIIPGEFRHSDVIVGTHIAPTAENINIFLERFTEVYNFANLSRVNQIISIAAAHHKLLWIHPFYDGNGRVTRLLSHLAFRQTHVGNSLWSISRGLARNAQEYKNRLSMADSPREGDLDGRGNLSQKQLINFCEFFLNSAIDQVDFMQKLLALPALLDRIENFAQEQIRNKILPKGSNLILKEVLFKGCLERKDVARLTGYAERQNRTIISTLIKEGLLGTNSAYGDLYLKFPQQVVEFYFPQLYPLNA